MMSPKTSIHFLPTWLRKEGMACWLLSRFESKRPKTKNADWTKNTGNGDQSFQFWQWTLCCQHSSCVEEASLILIEFWHLIEMCSSANNPPPPVVATLRLIPFDLFHDSFDSPLTRMCCSSGAPPPSDPLSPVRPHESGQIRCVQNNTPRSCSESWGIQSQDQVTMPRSIYDIRFKS